MTKPESINDETPKSEWRMEMQPRRRGAKFGDFSRRPNCKVSNAGKMNGEAHFMPLDVIAAGLRWPTQVYLIANAKAPGLHTYDNADAHLQNRCSAMTQDGLG